MNKNNRVIEIILINIIAIYGVLVNSIMLAAPNSANNNVMNNNFNRFTEFE